MKKYHSIPMRMQIETIFGCNAHCTMCPIDMPSKRKKGSMDFILFKKVIDKRESKKTHLPVFLVNVASKQNQIMLPIGLAVLVNSLRYHNIEPQLIDSNIIRENVKDLYNCFYYISGPLIMVQIMKEILLKMNIESKNIIEDYFPGYSD